MFSNLVESNSHTSELKRRGSFLLLTGATYALLFLLAAVASIYAFDARLSQQNLEIVTLMRLVDMPQPPAAVFNPVRNISGGTNSQRQTISERQVAIARTNQPQIVPHEVSSAPNLNPPLPDGPFLISFRDREGGTGGPTGGTSLISSPISPKPATLLVDQPPPPPQVQRPKPGILRKHVINSEAISLPKPVYPPIALTTKTQGSVAVQVLIDQTGRVISAQVMSGNPVLAVAALKAAYEARFSPTIVGNQPVKVSGIITYNFVLR